MIRPKFALTALLTIFFIYQASSQTNYNLQLISETSYPNNCVDWYSDVWGFQHSNGTEYAIIGGRCHTLIYDLSNPSAPSLIAEIEGDSSLWRDMKSWGDYVFSIADEGDDGLTIIDLTDPTMPTSTSFSPAFGTRFLERGHNLFVDHRGLLYIAGSNINNGGALIYDVSTTPTAPTLAGIGSGNYAHDVFVVGDIMITSELGTGFRISSLVFFGNLVFAPTEAIQETGNDFTHNAWSTADGSTLFTTDERSDAFVEAYDISDFDTGIDFLGRWSSPTTVGSGVIPHNVHVTEDDGCTWLVVSYYRDGLKIVDATDPSRMVEVGCYDTSPLSGSGFNGAWGATPPLPSGHILV
ncbi:MAG: choice-of-anchor B family protein, partial [Saprospiraceae bacterium]|nr:choice-of-anchor B family protein [Saprospiraceae bacterium]